jgi:hypothetical protein
MAICHPVLLPWKAENQPDGLDSGIITSIELSSPRRHHPAIRETVIPAVTKWACRRLCYGVLERDRPAGSPACCLRGMRHSWKPMPGNAKTAPAQLLSRTVEPIFVHQPIFSAGTTRALDRWPQVGGQIRPHKLAALRGGKVPRVAGRALTVTIGRARATCYHVSLPGCMGPAQPDAGPFSHADATVGSMEMLIGKIDLQQALGHEHATGLTLLPLVLDEQLVHSDEILSSQAFRNLIDQLRQRYEYIIMGLPPIAPVVDVRATIPVIDSLVFVVEWGNTRIKTVQHHLMAAPELCDRLLGVVLNKANLKVLEKFE